MNKKCIFILMMLSIGFCFGASRKPSLIRSNEVIFAADTTIISNSINSLAFKTFLMLDEKFKGQNMAISPSSLSMALAMAYAGSDGLTRKEFEKLLLINSNKKVYLEMIRKISETWQDSISKKDILSSNSIWISDDYNILPSFSKSINDNFHAEYNTMNLKDNESCIKAAKQINSYVEGQTKGLIKNMMKPEMLSPLTKLLLINVISFNAEWLYAFDPGKTSNAPFYTDSVLVSNVPFMNNEKIIPYYEDSVLQAISLPYKGLGFSMVIILPKNRDFMTAITKSLNRDRFFKMLAKSRKINTNFSIPKFKIESGYEARPILNKLGLQKAFSDDADFSSISGKKDLYISNVLQKAVVEINERETKAAAATSVIMRIKSARVANEKKYFKANRPFIFAIVDNRTNIIIFLGKVVKPEMKP